MRSLRVAFFVVLASCSTNAAPASTTADSATSPAATVVSLHAAPRFRAPNGKGSMQRLAQGRHAFVARLELDGDARIPEHRDASEEYIHVLAGSGTLVIDGQTYTLQPGSTVFMPANALVSFINGPERLVALQVFADPSSAAKYDAWSAQE